MNSMLQNILKRKISNLHIPSSDDKIKFYCIREVLQEIVLYSLYNTGFFNYAAFYGGTSLRLFHDLERFSEDLDFCIYKNSIDFDFSYYINEAEKIIRTFCLPIQIDIKEKSKASNIKTSLLKANKREVYILFALNESSIHRNENIKIKIELDMTPFKYHNTLTTFKSEYFPYHIQICDLPTLFAGKIHAILCRNWKSGRVKGRDLFDYVFFSSRKCSINLQYLQEKLVFSGFIAQDTHLTIELVQDFLKDKFKSIEYNEARKDVDQFVFNPYLTNAWSPDFFCFLARDLKADAPEEENTSEGLSPSL